MAAITRSIAIHEEDPADLLALDFVLAHCTQVKALVDETLQELSSVTPPLTDNGANAVYQPMVNVPRETSGLIEARLNEAGHLLAVASRVLASEIKERRMLDRQFADIKEQEATGRHRMLHDPLTGMPNRILFHDRLEHALAQSLRHGRTVVVMFMDLDGFKEVNDTYGHDMGDAVLQVLATRLQEHTRSEDTASRYGGDEFLHVFTDPGDHRSIVSIAERMIRLIQEPCVVSLNGTEVEISLDASVGISTSPKDGVTVDRLVKSADEAMYRAKQRKSGYSFAL